MKNTNTVNKISSKEACTLAHQIRRETGCSLADAFKAAYNRNTAPVAHKTSWTAEELNKLFSDKAAELMRKGYTMDLAGMCGHQGEIGKIVFTKNGELYALALESQNTFKDGYYSDEYTLWFGKYTEHFDRRNPLDHWNTIWLNKFEASWKQVFVKITDNYFVTPEVAEACNQKWHDRVKNHSTKLEEVSSKYNPIILKCIRKQKGYKTVKASEIVKVERITMWNSFEDRYNQRYYRVELSRQNKNGRNITVEVKFPH